MAITKYIKKLTHVDASVKIVNDGGAASVTIGLLTDLLRSNETIKVGVTPKVSVSAIEYSIENGTNVRVVRGGATTAIFFENPGEFINEDSADQQNADQDLTVQFSGSGVMNIRLLKYQGYLPNFRPEQGVS